MTNLPCGVLNVRKLPITVQAVEWTGGNLAQVQEFTGADKFLSMSDDGHRRAQGFTALVFDHLHQEWIPLRDRDLVMRGVDGEHYPCERGVFDRTYQVDGVAA